MKPYNGTDREVERQRRELTTHAQYRYPERWAAANRYANSLSRAQARYASGYIAYMKRGAVGNQPDRGRVPRATADAIREAIHALNLWGD